jgi:hypothetical protein
VESKNDVKDTAGITPAKPSKVAHSRHSSIFTAIPVPSRPSSVFPDSGTDTTHIPKKEMASLLTKPLALGRSTRVNGSRSSSVLSSANKPVVLAGVEGSVMGPPPLKSRPSIVGTPTPPVSFSHSSLARPTFHRRVSSVNSEHKVKTKISRTIVNASPAPSVLEQDEKENVDNASSRRRSMIPTLA